MQSNAREIKEMDGIPLILDSCNIDANNPYIMQWSIFALRNALENNCLNQELIL
jgi:ataxin-10